jgi:hypothetical protein
VTAGHAPAFSYIVPDECHDMHGDPPYCLDGGNPFDPQDQHLVTVGDAYLGHLVKTITGAPSWAKGNNAVVVTFDEGDTNAGCCGAVPGGGPVATIVVTNHGRRHFTDPTPYNHYSLLSTIQHSLGVGCLQATCDPTKVQPMSKLFAITGSQPVSTSLLPEPNYPTPTPTPFEPSGSTSATPSADGWTVVTAPTVGTNDNSLGAVAASSPTDIWAVGNFLPDRPKSNQDATLSMADHFDGHRWTHVPTANDGSNFDTFFGVAASGGRAWAVGVNLDANFNDRALVEAWDGSAWHLVKVPQPGSERDMFYSATATSPSDVWAVGTQEGNDGRFATLVEHWDGTKWSVLDSPNPGPTGNLLFGVTATGPHDVWAVGQSLTDSGPDNGLIEHWDGTAWTVAQPTTPHGTSDALFSVAAANGQVWAVGETANPSNGASALVEHFNGSAWEEVSLPPNGSRWTDLYGVTAVGDTVWAIGSFLDPTTGNFTSLVLQKAGDNWEVVHAPNPGDPTLGSNILGGVTASGPDVWAVGVYDNGGSRLPFIERTGSGAQMS